MPAKVCSVALTGKAGRSGGFGGWMAGDIRATAGTDKLAVTCQAALHLAGILIWI